MTSLGIAVAQVYDGDNEDTLIPKWYTTFVQHTDEAVLAGIRQQLGQFNSWFPRAGVFLNLCNSEEQPTVDFLFASIFQSGIPGALPKNHMHARIPAFGRDTYLPFISYSRRARF